MALHKRPHLRVLGRAQAECEWLVRTVAPALLVNTHKRRRKLPKELFRPQAVAVCASPGQRTAYQRTRAGPGTSDTVQQLPSIASSSSENSAIASLRCVTGMFLFSASLIQRTIP